MSCPCCGGPSMLVPLALVALAAAGYLALARRQRRGRGWSAARIASFTLGSMLLALGLAPTALPFTPGDFRNHMLAHLLIGMLAPIGLVMAAPMTLLLRSIPARWGRRVVRVLHSQPLRVLAMPAVALVLNLGGMAALYFTPLYAWMTGSVAVHHAVHLHFVAAGCLYTWVIAGPDPAPARPSVPYRIVVLGVAIVLHAVFAQLLYAGVGVAVAVPAEQLRGGAELMYYGGDLSELLLAVALVTGWKPAGRDRPAPVAAGLALAATGRPR